MIALSLFASLVLTTAALGLISSPTGHGENDPLGATVASAAVDEEA